MSIRYGSIELRRIVIAHRDGNILHTDMEYRRLMMRLLDYGCEFKWFPWQNIPDIIVYGADDPFDLHNSE